MKEKTDEKQIRRTLEVLFEPGQVIELRALDVMTSASQRPYVVSGYFDDVQRLTQAAMKLAPKAKGIYVTPNPLHPALLARAVNRVRRIVDRTPLTSDGDVIRRRWLLIDCDPVRPSGISATDDEHAAALHKVREIRDALLAEGWTPPIVADSGNGGHLLYRVDLPNDTASRDLLECVLKALAFRFNDSKVAVDQTVFNAGRIWKLYGTIARKGDHTADRPHRQSRILEVPEQ